MRRLLFALLAPCLLLAQGAHERHVVRTDPKDMVPKRTKKAMKREQSMRAAAEKQRGKSKLPEPATIQKVPSAEKMMAKSRSKERRPKWGIDKKPNK